MLSQYALLFRNVTKVSQCANHTTEYGNFHPGKSNFFAAFASLHFLAKRKNHNERGGDNRIFGGNSPPLFQQIQY
jgi:hypothetical protein